MLAFRQIVLLKLQFVMTFALTFSTIVGLNVEATAAELCALPALEILQLSMFGIVHFKKAVLLIQISPASKNDVYLLEILFS
jgi:hypothetical protein